MNDTMKKHADLIKSMTVKKTARMSLEHEIYKLEEELKNKQTMLKALHQSIDIDEKAMEDLGYFKI